MIAQESIHMVYIQNTIIWQWRGQVTKCEGGNQPESGLACGWKEEQKKGEEMEEEEVGQDEGGPAVAIPLDTAASRALW